MGPDVAGVLGTTVGTLVGAMVVSAQPVSNSVLKRASAAKLGNVFMLLLDVEAELDDVAVLHDVILAFDARLALGTGFRD